MAICISTTILPDVILSHAGSQQGRSKRISTQPVCDHYTANCTVINLDRQVVRWLFSLLIRCIGTILADFMNNTPVPDGPK